ncbi:hypothetical protein COCHEDRAFT_17648 [Bipolaris maydis C5]|uniref:Helicase-associated domain-containing protein n=1 Tax=Cochliobolus heterostrophus (strain C5 / ATCC 48332 / race O) TaxID=701091 RepID=M2ULF0_COCH5|nr:hypothetical protein COCHEDRAFT_17648 [Bipolaris maydis C5]
MERGHSPKRRKLDPEEYSIAPRPKFRKPNKSASSRAHTPKANEDGAHPAQESFDGPEPLVDDFDSMALDRDWYGGEENGHTFGDDTHNPFGGAESSWLDAQREAALTEKKQNNRASMRAQQKQKDVDAWETNRMLQSGVAQRRHFDDDFDDDEESMRVHILVHELRPPFLDGKTVFTKQIDPVPAVRDPQSDMAVFSRRGSRVVKEKRQQKERQKQTQEATSAKGTTLGNIMGIKEEDTDSAAPGPDEEEKQGGSKFAQHLSKQEGASAFSKSKTLREQRQYLPAFAVREDLLRVIRDNQRTNLANTVLLLKSLGVRDLLDFDFMDPPPQDTITTSLFDLWALGALDNIGNLTDLGRTMTAFPMDPSLAKLIITATEYECSEEMLTIVAMLSVPSVFYRPKERQEESDAAREKFFVPESDHLTLLHVYTQWKVNGYSDGWCIRHFLHPKALRRAKEIRDQILDIMGKQKMPLISCGTDWDVIRKCICSGYYHQAAKVKGIGEYINLRTSVTIQLHPTSALYGLGYLPDYVVYHELILTSKEYMSCVTAVDPHWLADLGAVFYSIKEKGYSARDKRIVETEFNKKAELERQMAEDKEREERRVAEEEAGPVVRKAGKVKKGDEAEGDGVVKRPVVGKSKFRRR